MKKFKDAEGLLKEACKALGGDTKSQDATAPTTAVQQRCLHLLCAEGEVSWVGVGG